VIADLGITRERVRQIQDKSLASLQADSRVACLRAYLIDDSKAGNREEKVAA
jgi:DNA-directed RNA polymerase sigma subunit (sigma70/sigma32)